MDTLHILHLHFSPLADAFVQSELEWATQSSHHAVESEAANYPEAILESRSSPLCTFLFTFSPWKTAMWSCHHEKKSKMYLLPLAESRSNILLVNVLCVSHSDNKKREGDTFDSWC